MDNTTWQRALANIESTVPLSVFTTWFKNTDFIEEQEGAVVFAVQNSFAKQQFEVKYKRVVEDALTKEGFEPESIRFVINESGVGRAAAKKSRSVKAASDNTTLDLSSSAKSKNKSSKTLSRKYTFDNFIVGSSNDLAYTAAKAVAQNPGTKYNPLFIYGGVGLGKTHLIQAIGTEILDKDPEANIVYISSETFVSEFLTNIRTKKGTFASRYRKADVLIIDDIQFFAGKEATQEEFFHTFNALHQLEKQIIISSDQPPKAIPTLEDRLVTRFEWGMTVDVQLPDFETRCAIVQSKAIEHGVTLHQSVVEHLAGTVQSNIRELEGALNQLLASCELRGVEPSVENVNELITLTRGRKRPPSPKKVVEAAARYFNVAIEDLKGPKRDRDIVEPRQVAMYLLRSELDLSYPRIARELGRSDHTTAIHSVKKVTKSMGINHVMRQQVNELKGKIYG